MHNENDIECLDAHSSNGKYPNSKLNSCVRGCASACVIAFCANVNARLKTISLECKYLIAVDFLSLLRLFSNIGSDMSNNRIDAEKLIEYFPSVNYR